MPPPKDLEPIHGRFVLCTKTKDDLKYASDAELARLNGKRAIVTGSNVGQGFETALALAKAGCHVTLACRNVEKAETAAATIREQVGKEVEIEVSQLDLSSLKSVRAFADRWKEGNRTVDILVQNAGLIPTQRETTDDGIELGLAVNCVAPLLLNILMLPYLARSDSPRLVNVTSESGCRVSGADFDNMQMEDAPRDYWLFPFRLYRGAKSYARAKFYQMLSIAVLADRLSSAQDANLHKIVCTLAHPGMVASGITNKSSYGLPSFVTWLVGSIVGRVGQTPKDGAQTSIWLATADEPSDPTKYNGSFWAACKQFALPPDCYDEEKKRQAWEKLCGLAGLDAGCISHLERF